MSGFIFLYFKSQNSFLLYFTEFKWMYLHQLTHNEVKLKKIQIYRSKSTKKYYSFKSINIFNKIKRCILIIFFFLSLFDIFLQTLKIV